ncbi:MAG: hypothetical protein ACREXQ_11190 [Polaromonas sp.]
MNAPCEAVFDAFHHHELRSRWDSLVKHPVLENGDEWPSVGAVTRNPGSGWMRVLSMRTQFVSCQRPTLAAAHMVGSSFPFSLWAASLKHRPLAGNQSELIYTYNIKARWWLRGWAEWAVHRVFRYETARRFRRMQKYLDGNLAEVTDWQNRRG